MDITKLQYFSAVYEAQNYTKAAEILFVSRQALQQVVKSLEGELGQSLFLRNKNRIVPTPFADTLYAKTQKVLAAYEELEQSLGQEQGGRGLLVGLSAGIHNIFTPEEIERCHARRYPFPVQYRSCNNLQAENMLLAGALDIAYMYACGEETPQLCYEGDKKGRLHLIISRKHRLAKRAEVSVADLAGLPFITQGEGYGLHRILTAACRGRGLSLSPVYATPDQYEIFSQVAAGLGFSYYPIREIYHFDTPEIECIPFAEPLDWSFGAIYKKIPQQRDLIQAYRRFGSL